MGNEVVVDGVLEKIVSFGIALQFPHQWRLINIAYINRVISIRISVLLLGQSIFTFRFRIEYCILCCL